MRRGVVFVVVPLVLLLLASALLAGEPPVPIEGMLLVQAGDSEYSFSHWLLTGSSDNVVPLPEALEAYFVVSPSPLQDEYAYTLFIDYVPGEFPHAGDIGRVGLDGNDPIALNTLAGVGGLNCSAIWSPDGSQLAFIHADPTEEEIPCEAGFEVWIINADGSGAKRVSPPAAGSSYPISWAPNGYRLLCKGNIDAVDSEPYTYIIDSDGSDYAVLWTGFGGHVEWSRDGSKLLATCYEGGEVEGEEGHWKILRLYDSDGSNPQDLFRNGMTQAEVMEIMDVQGLSGELAGPAIITRLAPREGHWSPLGDRIVFTGAMDYDPYGEAYNLQSEVWIYDVATEDLTQITDNLLEEGGLQWDGHNTFEYDPEVTVDNTTVAFEEVLAEGLTTIIRDDDLPDLPTGFMFAGESYRITTTCTPTGSIIVEMTYCDEEIPTGTEETLCIYHWDADGQTWEDITVSRDTVNNIVTGITDSLSPFGMTIPQRFSDVTFGNWAFLYIEACFRAGILGGYDDGTYRPAEPVDRASMAVYISRALAGGDDHIPTGPATATFTDVLTDHWAYKYVEYAYANDIVQGYGADVYAPAVTVDRAQMAVFIARAIVTPTDRPDLPSYTPPETATFSDVATDHWAYKYVEYIAQDAVAVSQGYDDGTYRPDVIVTRDQMAVYVQRAFELSM